MGRGRGNEHMRRRTHRSNGQEANMSAISTRATQYVLGSLLWSAVLLALIVVWRQTSSEHTHHAAAPRN
jgi:hypothetical protein